MRKHWAVWLVVIHVVVCSVFVVKERVNQWESFKKFGHYYDQPAQSPQWWQALKRHWNPPPPSEGMSFDLADIDYGPSLEEFAYRLIEMPVAALVGWYQCPMGVRDGSLLPIELFPGAHHIPFLPRIVVLDTLMIALVGLHWWLIGRLLKRHERLARWVKIPVIAVTSIGVIWAIVCLLPRWEWIRVPAGFAMILVVFSWAWIFGASLVLTIRAAHVSVQRRFARTN